MIAAVRQDGKTMTRLAWPYDDARRARGGDLAEPQGDGEATRRSPCSPATVAAGAPGRNPGGTVDRIRPVSPWKGVVMGVRENYVGGGALAGGILRTGQVG